MKSKTINGLRCCSACHETLDISLFSNMTSFNSKTNYRWFGLRSACKQCSRKQWSSSRKLWAYKNKDIVRENSRRWRAKNPERARQLASETNQRLRDKVFDYYGRECSCCDEKEGKFLSIDHINGGGNKHRKEIGRRGGNNFYRWLKKNNFPDGFQVLCYNCNFSKGMYGSCPHGGNLG